MRGADENLRHGHAAIRTLDHFVAALPIAAEVDFGEVDALAFQQGLGRVAIGAIAGGINFDKRHFGLLGVPRAGPRYMVVRTGATTRANTRTSTWAAPARNKARAQVSTVAPEVSTSSISTTRWPAISALRSGGTRNAPCTLSARSVFDRPTCCGVARTRLMA